MFNFEPKPLYVQNIGRKDFENGVYRKDIFNPRNSLLISINDPGSLAPKRNKRK